MSGNETDIDDIIGSLDPGEATGFLEPDEVIDGNIESDSELNGNLETDSVLKGDLV